MKHKIIGQALPNIPWENKPSDCVEPMWRYSKNPITPFNPFGNVARVFNSALVPWKGEYIGIFRGDGRNMIPTLYKGHSKDGIHIEFEEKPLEIHASDGHLVNLYGSYDPRVIPFEDGTYYIVYCVGTLEGPVLGFAKTMDFEYFEALDRPFIPCNRNGVLFPRKINGDYIMLSRPSGEGHNQFGDVWMSRSKDLTYWGKHQCVIRKGWEWWCGTKVGAGCVPIETDMGWLLFFHGVLGTCSGLVYSFGAAILDKDDPGKTLYRCNQYLLTPQESYEKSGFVPNVVFPVSALADAETGRIAVYYGAADSHTAIAFTDIDTILDFIVKNSDRTPTDLDSLSHN